MSKKTQPVVIVYCTISVRKPGVGFWKTGTRVLFSKTRVPGSGFGFSKMYKIDEFWLKNRQIGAFWTKSMKISLEIAKLLLFGPQNGDYYDFLGDFYLPMYVWTYTLATELMRDQIRFQIIKLTN